MVIELECIDQEVNLEIHQTPCENQLGFLTILFLLQDGMEPLPKVNGTLSLFDVKNIFNYIYLSPSVCKLILTKNLSKYHYIGI